MDTPKSVYYTTKDGAVREVRHGSGAMRRIQHRFGGEIGFAINKEGIGILPELLYLCMFDVRGNPPEGIDLDEFKESTPMSELPEMMACLLSAQTEGRAEKKALGAPIKKALAEQERRIMELTGYTSGPSLDNASESQVTSSGGSPNGNSTHSLVDTENSENLTTTAPV